MRYSRGLFECPKFKLDQQLCEGSVPRGCLSLLCRKFKCFCSPTLSPVHPCRCLHPPPPSWVSPPSPPPTHTGNFTDLCQSSASKFGLHRTARYMLHLKTAFTNRQRPPPRPPPRPLSSRHRKVVPPPGMCVLLLSSSNTESPSHVSISVVPPEPHLSD